MMKRQLTIAILLLSTLPLLAAVANRRAPQPAQNPTSAKQPVVVELFTSEGCSSCPPADTLLKQLSNDQPIDGAEVIALEEHVDYWNQLGWRDPYSSLDFSTRQQDYASKLRNGSVFTPQMIVDGTVEVIGSRDHEARLAIQRAASAPKAKLTLEPSSAPDKSGATFNVRVENLPPGINASSVELWVAVTEKSLQTNVKAGENSGETLQHADVVRSLQKVKAFKNADNAGTQFTVNFKDAWNPANLRVIAFLADKNNRHILGAAVNHPSLP
jgi:hypothetical protein